MSFVGRSRSKAHEGVLVHAECQVENIRLGRALGAIGVAFGITSGGPSRSIGGSLAWTFIPSNCYRSLPLLDAQSTLVAELCAPQVLPGI